MFIPIVRARSNKSVHQLFVMLVKSRRNKAVKSVEDDAFILKCQGLFELSANQKIFHALICTLSSGLIDD
jgi:hypothetical protein